MQKLYSDFSPVKVIEKKVVQDKLSGIQILLNAFLKFRVVINDTKNYLNATKKMKESSGASNVRHLSLFVQEFTTEEKTFFAGKSLKYCYTGFELWPHAHFGVSDN